MMDCRLLASDDLPQRQDCAAAPFTSWHTRRGPGSIVSKRCRTCCAIELTSWTTRTEKTLPRGCCSAFGREVVRQVPDLLMEDFDMACQEAVLVRELSDCLVLLG